MNLRIPCGFRKDSPCLRFCKSAWEVRATPWLIYSWKAGAPWPRNMIKRVMARDRQAARNLYEAHLEKILFLRQINVPLPRVFAALAQALLTDEIAAGVKQSGPGPLPADLTKMAEQAAALGLSLSSDFLKRTFEHAVTDDLMAVLAADGDGGLLKHADGLLNLAASLNLELNLWEAQNHYYRLLGKKGRDKLPPDLLELGQRLGFDLKNVTPDIS